MVKDALESLWTGKVTVYESQKVKDPVTGQTKLDDVCTVSDIPCRLSFSRIQPTAESTNISVTLQSVKLFLSPEIEVTAGSKLKVTQNGITTDYAQSGLAAVYSSHQEIPLELFKGWA